MINNIYHIVSSLIFLLATLTCSSTKFLIKILKMVTSILDKMRKGNSEVTSDIRSDHGDQIAPGI